MQSSRNQTCLQFATMIWSIWAPLQRLYNLQIVKMASGFGQQFKWRIMASVKIRCKGINTPLVKTFLISSRLQKRCQDSLKLRIYKLWGNRPFKVIILKLLVKNLRLNFRSIFRPRLYQRDNIDSVTWLMKI